MPRLRAVYPHVLHLERPAFSPQAVVRDRPSHREIGAVSLFNDFMRSVTGEELDGVQRAALESVLDAVAVGDD